VKVLTGLLWLATMATGLFGTAHAVSELHRSGTSMWRILFSGKEYYLWHGAPGWYYPTLTVLSVLAVFFTVRYVIPWHSFSRGGRPRRRGSRPGRD
jgi:hypothetical protein